MEKELIERVRQKAIEEGASSSKLGIAKHVVSKVDIAISERTFTNYLSSVEEEKEVVISREIKASLSRYLEFEDYNAFRNSMQKGRKRERIYIITILLLLAILISSTLFFNRKKCMIWDGDRYVKIHCEEAKAKPIDKRFLSSFKRVEAECEADFFFHEDGAAKVWYFKRGKNDLELFTMPGEHPVNGKTLDDITPYMINEHLCEGLFQ